jgi:hypothetical protein
MFLAALFGRTHRRQGNRTMRSRKRALGLTFILFFAAAAQAQKSSGPFTGSHSESFETQDSQGFHTCVPDRVFDGLGELCTPGHTGALITTGWTYVCTVDEHSGERFFGSAYGHAELTFASPVWRFGGYFATNSGIPGATVRFFDANDLLLGSAVISVPADCGWHWNGWQADSGVGFSRIEIIGNEQTGAYVQLDDLEIDADGPQPGAPLCACDAASGWPDGVCGNPGAAGRGCGSGSNPAGCSYSATGSTLVDSIVLHATGAAAAEFGLHFQGTSVSGSGAGVPFGDGLRCAGGGVVRIEASLTDSNGASSTGVRVGATGGVGLGDGTRVYQFWYRSPASPCGSGFNTSNAYEIVW